MTITRFLPAWGRTCARLLHGVGPLAPRLRASLVQLAAAAAMQGLALACVLPVFQAVFTARDFKASLVWLAVMSAAMLLATALRWRAQGFDYNGHMARATHGLRTRLGEQLRRMPLEAVQDRRAGEVNATLLGNVDEQLNYTLTIVNLILTTIAVPVVTALAAAAYDWRLGLCLLAVPLALIPLHRWRQPHLARERRALNSAHARVNADIVEYAQGLATLRAVGSVDAHAARLHAGFADLESIQTRAHRQGARPNVVIASVVELGLLGCAAAGMSWVVQGTLDPATLAAVLVIVVRFAEPLGMLVTFSVIFEMVEAALERIDTLLAVPPLPQHLPARRPRHFEVRFEQVGFRYARAGQATLQSVDLIVPACAMTALVGPSGAGKSTLVRLLMRHADPQAGRVTIGGIDVREIDPDVLNGMIATVFQEVYLFDDTVAANLRMARPGASDEDLTNAAREAQCLAFIERLPQGWQTRLGDMGAALSGGERQRLSIARALLKNAPIVILDEPTASLDTGSERAVQRAIDNLVRQRTVIVIAHRLSTIAGADHIAVIDSGRIVQQGTHDALLASPGRYRAMCDAQGHGAGSLVRTQ